MASAKTGTAVEVEVRIAASPETVFEFFTDPDKMIQWMGRSAELDPRPGGTMRCDINGRDVASGQYLELERPRRVVFSWGWEGEDSVTKPGTSTVEVVLAPDGDGTHLRLIHRDLPSAESAERHGHGWRHYAERLAAAAAGDDAGADPWAAPAGADAGN
ncbi:MAG: SRPBCC family protein [Solirubrobacterales bacterium]